MVKLYLMLIVLGVIGSVGAGAIWYYNDTQERLAVLQENNAKLESALETSEASINALQEDMAKFQALNSRLQEDLQKAEAYGDDLRSKLRQHDLTALALRKPGLLEGRMNGATAKLWREIVADTGGTPSSTLPEWLQPREQTGAGDQSSNQDRENNGTNSIEAEASSTN